jgi:hypothetical protein
MRFASEGSMPALILSRAADHAFLASANEISGYLPNANKRSVPAKRYPVRQYFDPSGLINETKNPRSHWERRGFMYLAGLLETYSWW